MFEAVQYNPQPNESISGKECRFATYVPPPTYEHPDLHYIKEAISLKDGTVVPNVRLEFDFKRPFWITKKGFRNHEQHKEWEKKSKLTEYKSTERNMPIAIANALGQPWLRDLKACLASPYVYGIDIPSTSVIKHMYQQKYQTRTKSTFCELDIETDMIEGHERTTMASLFMPPSYGQPAKCYTWITKAITSKRNNFLEELEIKTKELLLPILEHHRTTGKQRIKFEPPVYDIEFKSFEVETDFLVWKNVFKTLHEWQPDILSIWNIVFEMGKFLECCQREEVDPADLVCDPRIPQEYRRFKWIPGKAEKRMAGGRVMPIKPANRWNWVDAPSPFVFLDQMCVYRQIRAGTAEEPSYSLDAIQTKELKIPKLKFEQASHIEPHSPDWHTFMQKHYPVEYTVYNRFDVIGPGLVEEKTMDMSFFMPVMARTCDFKRFNSQPKRLVTDMHWELQKDEEPKVMGVFSKEAIDDYDDMTLDRDGWIVALPNTSITEEGMNIIAESDEINTRVYGFVGD